MCRHFIQTHKEKRLLSRSLVPTLKSRLYCTIDLRMSAKQRFLLTALLFTAPLLSGQMAIGISQGALTPPPGKSKPEDRCVLQGHVTNALTGEPLKKAAVRLARQITALNADGDIQAGQGYATISDAEGNFRIENIEPGDYHLSGNRNGYLDTQYGAKGTGRRGSILSLRAGQQLTNISLALAPQAVITGKVIDQDGDPVNGAMVQIVGQMWQRGKLRHVMRNGSNTNDLGEYRISSLSAGKYYLVVQRARFMPDNEASPELGKPDIRPVKTYYPDAPNIESATALDIKAGQDLSGMDIRLRTAPTYHIRGKIVGPLPDGTNDRLQVNASARGDDEMGFMVLGGTGAAKDRSFDIAGVAPGPYTVTVFSPNGPPKTLGHQEVDVGQGDVNNVQVMIVPPGTVHGQVSFDGNAPAGTSSANLKNVHLFLYPADPTAVMFGNNNISVKDDGTFTMDSVTPGKYYLNVNTPTGTYLKSVRLGNQEDLGKELDLSQGSGQIAVVFSYGVAEVEGTVQFPQASTSTADTANAGQSPATLDAAIVLVPDTLNEDGSGMHFGNSGSGGSFSVKQLPPGHYHAYALEKMDFQELQNPDVLKQLEGKGVDVDLRENDRKQIQLPLITDDDMQQIYARLGIEAPQN